MPLITKAMLYKNQESLEEVFQRNNLESQDVKVYGHIAGNFINVTKATADLNLLVKFKSQSKESTGVVDIGGWELAQCSRLQTDLSVLFDDACVEVYTQATLKYRMIGPNKAYKASDDSNQMILDKALPLLQIIEMGKKQSQLAAKLQKRLADSKLITKFNLEVTSPSPSELTDEQKLVLIELGKLYTADPNNDQSMNFARIPEIEDSLFALFSPAEQEVIKEAYHWNIDVAKQENKEEILQVLKEKGQLSSSNCGI